MGLKKHHDHKIPGFDKNSFLSRIRILRKKAEEKRDHETVRKLWKMEDSIRLNREISGKVHNSVEAELNEIESKYNNAGENILETIISLEKRAKKVNYEAVLDSLEKFRKHFSGEEPLKNNENIALKVKKLEEDLVMVEELVKQQQNQPKFSGNQK